MADNIQTEINRLNSQQGIRQVDRNAMLQREMQLQRLQQIQELQRQQQSSTQVDRESLKQSALNYLLAKGKANDAFRSLTKKEQSEVQDQANALESTRSKIQAIQQVKNIELQAGQSLTPVVKEQLIKDLMKTGEATYYQNQRKGYDIQSYSTSPYVSKSLPNINAEGQRVLNSFKQINSNKNVAIQVKPFVEGARELFTGEKLKPVRDTLTGRFYAEATASSKGLVKGTPEFKADVENTLKGIELQNAVISSIVGVPELPKTMKLPVREINPNPFGVEFQQPVINAEGQQKVLSSYQILQERTPPTEILKSDKNFGLLGTSDTILTKAPKYTITSTSLPIVDQGTAITLTTKSGKVGKVSSIKGSSVTIEGEEFLKNIKNLGISKDINALPENSKISLGYLEQNNLGLKLPEEIKTRYQASSITRPINQNERYELYKSDTFFKNLDTKKVNRPYLEMVVVKSKTPISFETNKGVNFIPKNINAKKTPLSVTFAKQDLIETPKPLPEIIKAPKTQIISKGESSKSYGNVGLLSGSISRNADRTSSSFSDDFSRGLEDFTKSKTKAQETPKQKLDFQNLSLNREPQLNINFPKASQFSISLGRQSSPQLNIPSTKNIITPSSSDVQLNKQASGMISLLRSTQTTQQQNMLRNILKARFNETLRTPPNKNPINIKIPTSNAGGINLKKVGTEDNFGIGIEVRRRGRFTLIGQESSIGRAVMKASNFVDVNLARSFRLRQLSTGNLLEVPNLPTGFRRSKRESKTFVELSSRSLSQFGEKKEIQYFKKAKSKRRKNFI